MRKSIGLIAILWLLVGAPALAREPEMPIPPPVVVPPLPSDAKVAPFGFSRLVFRLTPGQIWLSPFRSIICDDYARVPWEGGQANGMDAGFAEVFQTEVKAAGFKGNDANDSLFEEARSSTDLQVGGMITSINAEFCKPTRNITAQSWRKTGQTVIDMRWQVYSTVRRTVVATIETRGGAELKGSLQFSMDAVLVGAFRDNVRALLASDAFRQAVSGTPVQSADIPRADAQTAIPLAGALDARGRPIADAVASVVIIRVGDGMGSGFLVSADGLLITDQHVVGDAATVGVRWSDGVETVGTVIRTNKVRDVALVKTDPRGRHPLSLQSQLPQTGEGVFAIGAPLEAAYQNTASHGVVSAYRISGGLGLIQSDVFVNHGNSGGPLLNEKGEVVGITESGVSHDGERQAISFFTPIGEALKYLGAERR